MMTFWVIVLALIRSTMKIEIDQQTSMENMILSFLYKSISNNLGKAEHY